MKIEEFEKTIKACEQELRLMNARYKLNTNFAINSAGFLCFNGVATPYCCDDVYSIVEKCSYMEIKFSNDDYLCLHADNVISGKIGELYLEGYRLLNYYRNFINRNKSKETFLIKDNVIIRFNNSFDTVYIPEGIIGIGDGAFYNSIISELYCSKSLQWVGTKAFAHCGNLSKVVLNDGLKTIAESAFCDCEKLTSIDIPKSVKQIQREAFKGTNIENINFKTIDIFVEKDSFPMDCKIEYMNLFDKQLKDVKTIKQYLKFRIFELFQKQCSTDDWDADISTYEDIACELEDLLGKIEMSEKS